MHDIGMFDRKGPLALDGFDGSGAVFMPQYKKYIEDGKTIVAAPHKVYGPENNDLILQLHKRRVDQVVLAGMSANLCVEAVKDATAAAKLPEGDGYLAAIINFRYITNALWSTEEAIRHISGQS